MNKLKCTYGVANEMTAVCPKQAQVRAGSFQCLDRCKFNGGRIPESEAKPITHVMCSYEAGV